MDVLGHVVIQCFQGLGVGLAPAPPWDLPVLDTAELVILLPEIGFDDLDCGQEPEYGHVSLGDAAALRNCRGRRPVGQHPCAERSGSEREARSQEAAAAGEV